MTKNKSTNNIAGIPADDAILVQYKEQAQAGLGYLIEFMNKHERDETMYRYAIKSNFHENGLNEHMWTQVRDFKDDYFIGALINEPASIKLIQYGDAVKVHRDDVEDWILEDFLTNTRVGGFSSGYLRKKAK